MEPKIQKAIESFKTGHNCAQAVLTAYITELKFDADWALSLSSGFGGGMGRLQKTCGAVTGSFMVLGLYNGTRHSENVKKKEMTGEMVREFNAEFTSIHNSLECKDLLACDLNTDEGQAYATDNHLFERVCEKCIEDSILIIEKIISKDAQV